MKLQKINTINKNSTFMHFQITFRPEHLVNTANTIYL